METLDVILNKWNELYDSKVDYKSIIQEGPFVVLENSGNASLNELELDDVRKALVLPNQAVKDYCLLENFKLNCDKTILYENVDGTYSLLMIEMKSKFSTQELYKARLQIQDTALKFLNLLNPIKEFRRLIVRLYGIIASNKPDDKCLMYLSKLSELPAEEQNMAFFALNLHQHSLDSTGYTVYDDQGKRSLEYYSYPITFYYYPSSSNKVSMSLPVV